MVSNSASTRALLGKLFDRDDAVEEGMLFEGFDETALVWQVRNASRADEAPAHRSSQTRFGVPYSTSGHPTPLVGVLLKLTETLHGRGRPRNVSLAQIDHSHLLVYGEADSTLSHPCERNSIAVSGDADRARRSREIEERVTRNMKLADKGKLDIGLARRATAMLPAFVGNEHPDLEWSKVTLTGYPCSRNGVIVSGNVISKGVLTDPREAVWVGVRR